LSLSKKRKWTLLAAVLGVGVILLVVHVIVPLATRWQDLGFQLERKQARVARLNERLNERDFLIAERDRLSAILGSVLGPEAYPPRKEEPKDKKTEEKKAGAQEKDKPNPAAQGENGPIPDQPDAKKPEAKEPQGKAQEEKDDAEKTVPAENPKEPTEARDGKSAQASGAPADPDQDKKPTENKKTPDKTKETPAPKGVSFVAHIERTAKKSGVSLKRLSRRNPVRSAGKVPQFTAVGLQLSFDTKVQQLTKFLYALENEDRLVRIERLDFRRDLKKPENIQVSLNIVGYESATGK